MSDILKDTLLPSTIDGKPKKPRTKKLKPKVVFTSDLHAGSIPGIMKHPIMRVYFEEIKKELGLWK
jgi:hypothetical protein